MKLHSKVTNSWSLWFLNYFNAQTWGNELVVMTTIWVARQGWRGELSSTYHANSWNTSKQHLQLKQLQQCLLQHKTLLLPQQSSAGKKNRTSARIGQTVKGKKKRNGFSNTEWKQKQQDYQTGKTRKYATSYQLTLPTYPTPSCAQ